MTEVLIFTMHESEALMAELLQAGARAFLLKSDANQYLLTAIESLAQHKPFFVGKPSEKLLEAFISTHVQVTPPVLTPRERVIVQLIAEGQSNKKMAEILDVSIKTIESHRATAMRKVSVTSTAALVRYAIRNKIVEA
jgi:DNA-binding NarL/FixJ family response regulator